MRHGLVHDVDPRARPYGGATVTGDDVAEQADPVDGWWAAGSSTPSPACSDETRLPWVLAPERPAS